MTGRADGPDKVTGRARYAFEYPVDGAAYAWAVPSVIARGTIRSVDATGALAVPGVLAVITADNVPRLPGDEPDRETTLERGDLITAVEIPPLGCARNSAYRKVRDRASYAFAVVSVAAALDVDGGRVRDVRLAIGAVAPVPWRARTAERVLAGRPATAQWFGRAADAELAAAAPLPDNAFKLTLARNVIIRMLCELARTGPAGAAPAGAGS